MSAILFDRNHAKRTRDHLTQMFVCWDCRASWCHRRCGFLKFCSSAATQPCYHASVQNITGGKNAYQRRRMIGYGGWIIQMSYTHGFQRSPCTSATTKICLDFEEQKGAHLSLTCHLTCVTHLQDETSALDGDERSITGNFGIQGSGSARKYTDRESRPVDWEKHAYFGSWRTVFFFLFAWLLCGLTTEMINICSNVGLKCLGNSSLKLTTHQRTESIT